MSAEKIYYPPPPIHLQIIILATLLFHLFAYSAKIYPLSFGIDVIIDSRMMLYLYPLLLFPVSSACDFIFAKLNKQNLLCLAMAMAMFFWGIVRIGDDFLNPQKYFLKDEKLSVEFIYSEFNPASDVLLLTLNSVPYFEYRNKDNPISIPYTILKNGDYRCRILYENCANGVQNLEWEIQNAKQSGKSRVFVLYSAIGEFDYNECWQYIKQNYYNYKLAKRSGLVYVINLLE